MSLILSLHRYDGWAWYGGDYVFSITLGWITLTLTTVTVESLLNKCDE